MPPLPSVSSQRAQQDADSLYKAGAGKMGTDERTFNAIFTQRSYQHLRAVFEEYQRVGDERRRHSIERYDVSNLETSQGYGSSDSLGIFRRYERRLSRSCHVHS